MTRPRVCLNTSCGAELVPRPRERPGRFGARNYCNHTCRNTRGVAADREPPRRCQLRDCGAEFTRHQGESEDRYLARDYCSRPCKFRAQVLTPDAAAESRTRRAARARERRAAERPTQEPRPARSVFGDAPPTERWRPAAWR